MKNHFVYDEIHRKKGFFLVLERPVPDSQCLLQFLLADDSDVYNMKCLFNIHILHMESMVSKTKEAQ